MRTPFKFHMLALVSLLAVAFMPANNQEERASYRYRFYLGCMHTGELSMRKTLFDSLIAQPFCAKDSTNGMVTIQSFEILYAERGLYQDSAGLPIIFTDYTRIPVEGNQLDKVWVEQFKERSYKGDTVIIQQVKVAGTDRKSHLAEGMRVIIQ